MRTTAVIIGVSKFTYKKNNQEHNAATLYFTYPDQGTEGLRSGQMFVGENDPDYPMLTDYKNLNRKAQLLSTYDASTKRTNWAFCNYVEK